MRRGIGVAHVQQKKQQSLVMADLGAAMTAERISLLADQLDELKRKYTELSQLYHEDIKSDPLARTKLRQLGDALGVTVPGGSSTSSASTTTSRLRSNNNSRDLQLAATIIELCVQERKYYGATIPVEHIRSRLSHTLRDSSSYGDVSTADIIRCLPLLASLGPGYDAVNVDGETYIQTLSGREVVSSINTADALRVQAFARQRNAELSARSKKRSGTANNPLRRMVSGSSPIPQINVGEEESSNNAPDCDDCDEKFPVFSCFLSQIRSHFDNWPIQRLQQAIQREVADGNIWIEECVDGCDTASQLRYWFVGVPCGGFLDNAA